MGVGSTIIIQMWSAETVLFENPGDSKFSDRL